jgi:hypothetical protein
MPAPNSARLDLPYLAAGQLQKHVTVNEALTRLDALAQMAVISRSVAVEPDDPGDGDLYILPPGATGPAWSAWSTGALVRAELGGWTLVPTPPGVLAFVLDVGDLVVRLADGWTRVSPPELQNLARLGLNTTADATNPFAARVNKALWTALPVAAGGDGDLRFTFNKEGAGDVLSLLFQSGFGGRAEFGLIGEEALSLKVSDDGAVWREALRTEAETGRIWFARGALRAETIRAQSSGDYVPPDWARLLTVVALGGGGGGGTGGSGPDGVRPGGGGGGAGGLSTAMWRVEDLAGPLALTIGQGGAAGSAGGTTSVTAGGIVLLTARGGAAGIDGTGGGAGGAAGAGVNGGNAGGATSATAAGEPGESAPCPAGPGGGGGGGGLDAGGTARAGGDGGPGGWLTCPAPAGAGGAGAAGAAGAAPPSTVSASGGGGGGGAAAGSGPGHAGGAGGGHGAGGGGGGAGVTAGGSGGAGAAGVVLILVQG